MNRSAIGYLASIFLLFIITKPADGLILPPDPFDTTDRYVLLFPAADGTMTQVQAKVKAPGPGSLGLGEVVAQIRYKLPPGVSTQGAKTFYFSVSSPVPIQGLSPVTPVLITFDFSQEPIPSQAYHRSLEIFYISPNAETGTTPQSIAEYPPERLLVRPGGLMVETQLAPSETAVSGSLLLGPLTVLRERGAPQTETISFTVTDTAGTFFLT